MATESLFTVPIINTASDKGSSGNVVCSCASPGVYILTFTAPPDNRLLTSFCQALILALDILEFSYPHGVVITTSGIKKFYSNGLDLEHASNTEGFFANSMFALFKRLLTYPMPTVALVNGHAFAGGFMLAMYHDYRIFNPTRGFLCLNELDLGVPLRPAMSSVFRQKLTPQVYKEMVLEAKRYSGSEALEKAIVDALGDMEELLKFVAERQLAAKSKTGVYGLLKAEMFRESLDYLEGDDRETKRDNEYLKREEERKRLVAKRVAEWEKNAKKAKL
ncbi:enoyl-CoA hydratase/isomerase [Diplocarpon rosae]|nr:enoyl-CoA hydratase/isomerase [Diplocarpon rosae]